MATEDSQILVHVIGPGHGESIVLQFPDDSLGIIDPYCGKTILNRFNRASVHPLIRLIDEKIHCENIRFVLVTHPHADHCLGTSHFLEHYSERIEQLWVYDAFHSTTVLRNLHLLKEHGKKIDSYFKPGPILRELKDISKWIAENRSKLEYVNGNTGSITLPVGGITVDFHSPTSQTLFQFYQPVEELFEDVSVKWESLIIPLEEVPTLPNLNHLSVVMQLTWDTTKLLFCADAQEHTWNQLLVDGDSADCVVSIDSHFVKISHHGSDNGYSSRMFPFKGLDSSPVGVLTPYNQGVGLPSSTALSELSPHFDNIVTTCFPLCPNLYLWEPVSGLLSDAGDLESPEIPIEWLSLISDSDELEDVILKFKREKAPEESVRIPIEWIDQIVDEPAYLNLLREPYRKAAFVLAEHYKTDMIEDLFRVVYAVDNSGNITCHSLTKGCAHYKGLLTS